MHFLSCYFCTGIYARFRVLLHPPPPIFYIASHFQINTNVYLHTANTAQFTPQFSQFSFFFFLHSKPFFPVSHRSFYGASECCFAITFSLTVPSTPPPTLLLCPPWRILCCACNWGESNAWVQHMLLTGLFFQELFQRLPSLQAPGQKALCNLKNV